MAQRPSYANAWARFAEINVPVADVGRKIGGKVGQNIAGKIFENACPIRMSYVLNNTGVLVPARGYAVSSGADKLWYMYRVPDMMKFMQATFGTADKTVRSPAQKDFGGMKGFLVVKGHGWDNAVGHVTIWSGTVCADSCHLANDPDNGAFLPDTASLWVLK